MHRLVVSLYDMVLYILRYFTNAARLCGIYISVVVVSSRHTGVAKSIERELSKRTNFVERMVEKTEET